MKLYEPEIQVYLPEVIRTRNSGIHTTVAVRALQQGMVCLTAYLGEIVGKTNASLEGFRRY